MITFYDSYTVTPRALYDIFNIFLSSKKIGLKNKIRNKRN